MTLFPGTRLGPYEVLAPLGAGGMGEVYRARDTRLGREVAIKVLPAERSPTPDAARASSARRGRSPPQPPEHRHLHEIEREGGVDFIVMELVAGETLDAPHPRRQRAAASARRCASRSRSPTRSPPRTRAASSTATSSPATSW